LLRFVQFEEVSVRKSISKLRIELREIIEPDDGLLMQLLEKKVLTREQYYKICSKDTVYEKTDQLLECLLSRSYTGDYSDVMAILKKADQRHVVNFISGNGSMCFFF
jgi:hypothetical protein